MAHIWSYKTGSYLINASGLVIDVDDQTCEIIVEHLSTVDVLAGDQPNKLTASEEGYSIE